MIKPNSSIIEFPSLDCLDAWDAPILFDDFEAPEIPARLLPNIFREFAVAASKATETAEALSVISILGTISAILAKKVFVCPKEGWREPVNIYGLVALPPANNKSIVLNYCIKPLISWEKEQAAKLSSQIKRLCSERKTQEKIIEALRYKASKATDIIEQQQLTAEIINKEALLTDVPVIPLLFTNDATPESLALLVHEQRGRMAIFSDEGGILETLAGLYTNGIANLDILLKGIDGGEVRVRRKDRCVIINPYLTVILTVQPTILINMALKRAFMGNGTLERFLYVLPKSNLGYRTHNNPPLSTEIQSAYNTKIFNLLNLFNLAENDESHVLQLSTAAYNHWRIFQNEIELQLRVDGRLSGCQGWGGKICGFALRIAGLLHVAEYEMQSITISESTMLNALEVARLLTDHAIAAFGLMGVDQSNEDAKTILQWIKSQSKPSLVVGHTHKCNTRTINISLITISCSDFI